MSVKINKVPGRLPDLWDRQAIFFANLLSLFYGNESETEVLRRQVGSLETYGGRLIPILNLMFRGKCNLLILEREPDTVLLAYFQQELGLTLPQIKIIPHSVYSSVSLGNHEHGTNFEEFLADIAEHPAEWIDGFVTDHVLKRIAGLANKNTISSLEGSRHGNNKLLLYEHLCRSALPLFDTFVAERPQDLDSCLEKLKSKGYSRAVIKAQIGASGIGMSKVDIADHSCVSDYLFYEGACLVQGWLDDSLPDIKSIGSPSVQMFIDDNSISLYDITEQILSEESIHEGNIAPPGYLAHDKTTQKELLRQAEIAGEWLYLQGYRGTASVDFHLVKRGRSNEIRVCEINARVTGATYPAILARYFMPQGSWIMRNIRFVPPLKSSAVLKALDRAGLLYRPGAKEGILPINFNTNAEDLVIKGQFLAMGAGTEDTRRLLEEICGADVMKGDYDRD